MPVPMLARSRAPRRALTILTVLTVLLVIASMGGQSAKPVEAQTAPEILLKSREFTPAPGVDPALLVPMEQSRRAGADRIHLFLQFERMPNSVDMAALDRADVSMLEYVPELVWLVSAPTAADLGDLAQIEPVRWVGYIHPDDKTEASLAAGDYHEWARDDEGNLYVVVEFFADVSLAEGEALVADSGGTIVDQVVSINAVVAHLPESRALELSELDEVEWVEQVMPGLTEINDGARPNLGVDTLQAPPYDLDGSGVNVFVYDAGAADNHPDFGGRLVVQAGAGGISTHATHVAGTIGGDGSSSAAQGGSPDQWRGMAPKVGLISDDYNWGAGLLFYNNPGTIEADHTDAVANNGADLVNTSLGMNLCRNYGVTDWYGDYTTTAQLLDNIVTGSWTGGKRLPLIWAAGNERGYSCRNYFDADGHRTVDPPHATKNAIVVGATNSNDSSITTFTGFGPVKDGRLKPDITGPGCQNGGDRGIKSTFPGGGYGVYCGTSMAAPAVTGVAALLLQQWRATFGTSDPLPSTYKAVMAHTAKDLYSSGPDYRTGFGLVRAQEAADAIRARSIVQSSLAHGDVDRYTYDVQPGDTELRVTLAWDDPPPSPISAPQLVNNLDLAVVDPGGTVWYPWLLDPNNPGSAAGTGVDVLNNLEQVLVEAPEPGRWQIRVTGAVVPQAPQRYSLLPFQQQDDAVGGVSVGDVAIDAVAAVDVVDGRASQSIAALAPGLGARRPLAIFAVVLASVAMAASGAWLGRRRVAR